MNSQTNTELAYFAGLIDGEGCISITFKDGRRTKSNPSGVWVPYIAVNMCSQRLTHELQAAFGGCCTFKRYQPSEKWKPQWLWQVRSNDAKAACEALLPYLRIKQRQAEIVVEIQSTRTHVKGYLPIAVVEHRMRLLNEVRKLNKRGTERFIPLTYLPEHREKKEPTKCRRGHPIEHTRVQADGSKKCRLCRRKCQRAYKARVRAARKALGAPRGEFVTLGDGQSLKTPPEAKGRH